MKENDIDSYLRANRPQIKDNPTFLLEVEQKMRAVDGYWDYIMPASYHKKEGLGDLDLSPFYGKIPQGKSQYVYNKTNCTVTIINGSVTNVARLLVPGSHDFQGKTHEVIATFALDFDLGYTGPNVPGYAQDWSDFERFYVVPQNYVLHLSKNQ